MAVYRLEPQPTPAQVRFEAISEAWQFLTGSLGTWIGALVLYLLAMGATAGVAYGQIVVAIMGMSRSGQTPANVNAAMLSIIMGSIGLYLFLIVAAILAGIFLNGGLVRMAIKQVKGESIGIGDLFSAVDVFLPLLGYSILAGLAGWVIQIPAAIIAAVGGQMAGSVAQVVCSIASLYLSGLLICGVPLIVDKRVGVIEAFQQSLTALSPHGINAALFTLVIGLIAGLGALLCGVGMLFTVPLMYLAQAILYRDFFLGGANRFGPTLDIPLPPSSAYDPNR